MTSPTPEGALAIERARGDEYRAQIRAEGFRAGAEAMREKVRGLIAEHRSDRLNVDELATLNVLDSDIRSLDIPEDTANG